jgi:starch synthase
MRIAHLSAEVSPFAKSGGLGDVAGALPKAQAELGHDVTVWMPLYREVWETLRKLGQEPEVACDPFAVRIGGGMQQVGILRTWLPGSEVPLYLVGADDYFDRPQIYSLNAAGEDDGIVRYAVFVRAVLEAMQRLWNAPEVLHAHDWHTALAPMALAWDQPRDWVFNNTATVMTIHNLAYQGLYPRHLFPVLGLPAEALPQLEWGGSVNLMKGALLSADIIGAVSPTFAQEITTADGGFGLNPILRMRSRDLIGIVNGIDPRVWSPATDPKIVRNYDTASLEGKLENRRALLTSSGMDPEDPGFVVGVIGRLTHQKGFDLLFPVLGELIGAGIRIIMLGSGERDLERQLHRYSNNSGGRFWGFVGFRDDLAHQIEAGVDSLLMPSRFEPCGLNQLYSLAYGTPPIVRRTGGLADTVIGYEGWNRDTATGFTFDAATSSALRDTVLWAQHCYRDSGLWTQLALNGMRQDYSWGRSAQVYSDVYRVARERKGLG